MVWGTQCFNILNAGRGWYGEVWAGRSGPRGNTIFPVQGKCWYGLVRHGMMWPACPQGLPLGDCSGLAALASGMHSHALKTGRVGGFHVRERPSKMAMALTMDIEKFQPQTLQISNWTQMARFGLRTHEQMLGSDLFVASLGLADFCISRLGIVKVRFLLHLSASCIPSRKGTSREMQNKQKEQSRQEVKKIASLGSVPHHLCTHNQEIIPRAANSGFHSV